MSDDKKKKKILDSDADGLFDHQEESLGTNPLDPDTDSDGLGDNEEVNVYHTDPLDPDTDSDNIYDGVEVRLGRNPKGPGKLKDLFIPHRDNNYKPHILHPKRLMFHAVSAIIVKVIMVAFALSLPVQAWLSPDVLYQQAQKIIQLTNSVRTNLGLASLIENQVLSQAALNKAEDMLIDQYFAHVGPDDRSLRHWLSDIGYNFRVAGENLAIGFSSADQVVAAWENSPTHYSNLIDPDYKEIGVGVVSGEYNGSETTLVAQYFGDPYVIAVSQPVEPVIEQETVKTEDYDSKIEQSVDNLEELEEEVPVIEEVEEVLAEKENVVLEQPILTSPKNQYISKDNLNVLSIVAKGADRVVVYSNGENIVSKVLTTEEFNLAVKLAEGQNNLYIRAYQGQEYIDSKYYLISVDTIAPVVDQEKTSILVNRPNDSDDMVLKATAYLSADTKKVTVDFSDYQIALSRDNSEENKWTGHTIVSDVDYEDLFNPVTLATLTALDNAGNKTSQDISWEEVKPVVGSSISQYSFLKKNKSEVASPLFNLGNIYYQIMLVIALAALALNIFVRIKKQHTSTIASTLGFIALIAVLTIF